MIYHGKTGFMHAVGERDEPRWSKMFLTLDQCPSHLPILNPIQSNTDVYVFAVIIFMSCWMHDVCTLL